eukprot:910933-Amphidinium_carterae.1
MDKTSGQTASETETARLPSDENDLLELRLRRGCNECRSDETINASILRASFYGLCIIRFSLDDSKKPLPAAACRAVHVHQPPQPRKPVQS